MSETMTDKLIDALGDAQARIGKMSDRLSDLNAAVMTQACRLEALENARPNACTNCHGEDGKRRYTVDQFRSKACMIATEDYPGYLRHMLTDFIECVLEYMVEPEE